MNLRDYFNWNFLIFMFFGIGNYAKAQMAVCQIYDTNSKINWSVLRLNSQQVSLSALGGNYTLNFESLSNDGSSLFTDGVLCLNRYLNGSLRLQACHDQISYFQSFCGEFGSPQKPPPIVVAPHPPPIIQPQAPPTFPFNHQNCTRIKEGVYWSPKPTSFGAGKHMCTLAQLSVSKNSGQVSMQYFNDIGESCENVGLTNIFDCSTVVNDKGVCKPVGNNVALTLISENIFVVKSFFERTWNLKTAGQTVQIGNCGSTSISVLSGFYSVAMSSSLLNNDHCTMAEVVSNSASGLISIRYLGTFDNKCNSESGTSVLYQCSNGSEACTEVGGTGQVRIVNNQAFVITKGGKTRSFNFNN